MRARRPCAYHFSWLQDLSDDEILHWPEIPPSFPEDMSSVRDQVRGELGRVDVPPTWDGTHSENPETKKKDVVWFALNEDRLLFAFGGLWTEFNGYRGTKSKPMPGPHLVYGFLTMAPRGGG
jgi:hypothetical protein